MPAPLVLPISAFEPDLPDYPGEGSSVVLNVYPRTPVSYGAVGSPARQYNALGSRCQGAAAYRDRDGGTFLFAGDATDLFLAQAGSATWQNASKTPGAYNAGDQTWRFAYFNGDVIATDFGDAPQVITLSGGSTFNDLPGGPPRGKYIAVIKNAFVAFGNTFDNLNGNMPQRIWWCAAGNSRDWPVLGSDDAAQKQSGAVDLLGPGGSVQGFAPDLINADAVVFMEYAVRRMIYAGPPNVFDFLPVENASGCLAPDSIVAYGGIAYYWGQDGVKAFDGAISQPIGANRVDKFLLGDGNKSGDVDQSNISRVVGAADPFKKLIWWAYPSTQNVGGNPDRLLAYNWQLDKFSLVEVTCETLTRLLSIGYTLDELFTIFGYTVDTVPAPFDSSIWQGGRVNLGLFDSSHILNFLTGSALAATVDTTEMQAVPGRRVFIKGSRPLVDGTTTVPSVAIGHRERLQDVVAFSPASALNSMGTCPARTSGRYIRVRTTIPAGADWTNIAGVEIDAVPQGLR